jgi:hypothetical protein
MPVADSRRYVSDAWGVASSQPNLALGTVPKGMMRSRIGRVQHAAVFDTGSMNEVELRDRLRAVVEDGFAVPISGALPLARDALDALGSPDPVLRDELAYGVLARWIYGGVLTVDEVRALLLESQGDDMLFAAIGERGTMSVFRRTFSLLIVAVALARDLAEPFLSEREWRDIVERIIAYCETERDVRAHVARSGWAHAIAHSADVIDALVGSRYAAEADARRLFDGLAVLIDVAHVVFQGEEDERVAIALATMITSGKVDPRSLRGWLQAQAPAEPGGDFAAHVRRVNWKLIARSLLLRIQREHPDAADEVVNLDQPFSIY